MAVTPAFLKAYKALVEKPGASTHTSKWDRCVEEVKAKGSGANAYAVCTAMLGDESFKSMEADDPRFGKELDEFIRTLGIAGAGPVPGSLLARQDLEGSTRKSAAVLRKSESEHELTVEIINGSEGPSSSATAKDGSSSFSVWYSDASGNRKCEVYQNIVDAEAAEHRLSEAGFKNVYIRSSQEEVGTQKAQKCYVIRANGGEYMRLQDKADAEAVMEGLKHDGVYAVLLEESIVGETEKGAVEQTGKQLDRTVRLARKAEDTEDVETLTDRIKNIQVKRQKATIVARQPKGTFKSVWASLNKNRI